MVDDSDMPDTWHEIWAMFWDWLQKGYVVSVATVLGGYLVTWCKDRQQRQEKAQLARLKAQVICLGKITQAFKLCYASIDSYGKQHRKGAAEVSEKLANKYFPQWYEQQLGVVGDKLPNMEQVVAQSSDDLLTNKIEQVEAVWRNLHLCANLPQEFHQEIQDALPMKVWFAHVRSTILPQNQVIEVELIEKRHLLPTDDEFSEQVERFFEYAEDYKRMVHLWDVGDYTLTMVTARFPKKLPGVVEKTFKKKMKELAKSTYKLEHIPVSQLCCCRRRCASMKCRWLPECRCCAWPSSDHDDVQLQCASAHPVCLKDKRHQPSTSVETSSVADAQVHYASENHQTPCDADNECPAAPIYAMPQGTTFPKVAEAQLHHESERHQTHHDVNSEYPAAQEQCTHVSVMDGSNEQDKHTLGEQESQTSSITLLQGLSSQNGYSPNPTMHRRKVPLCAADAQEHHASEHRQAQCDADSENPAAQGEGAHVAMIFDSDEKDRGIGGEREPQTSNATLHEHSSRVASFNKDSQDSRRQFGCTAERIELPPQASQCVDAGQYLGDSVRSPLCNRRKKTLPKVATSDHCNQRSSGLNPLPGATAGSSHKLPTHDCLTKHSSQLNASDQNSQGLPLQRTGGHQKHQMPSKNSLHKESGRKKDSLNADVDAM